MAVFEVIGKYAWMIGLTFVVSFAVRTIIGPRLRLVPRLVDCAGNAVGISAVFICSDLLASSPSWVRFSIAAAVMLLISMPTSLWAERLQKRGA